MGDRGRRWVFAIRPTAAASKFPQELWPQSPGESVPGWSKFDCKKQVHSGEVADAQLDSLSWPLSRPSSAGDVGYSQLTTAPFSGDLPSAEVAALPRRLHTSHHREVATANDQKPGGTTGWLSCFKEGYLCGAIYASDFHPTHVEDHPKARYYLRHFAKFFPLLFFFLLCRLCLRLCS